MTKLNQIPVRVEFNRPTPAKPDIVKQVLHDIHAALAELQASGQSHAIDVRQLPRLSVESYQALRDALSQGEVTAVINAEIKVEVTETQYPGVWWLRHFNARDEISIEVIEITEMPSILKPHRVDVRAGMQKLEQRLRLQASQAEAIPLPG
jgi:hydrogenase-1 operon protein HyaF